MQALITLKDLLYAFIIAIILLFLTIGGIAVLGVLLYMSLLVDLYEEFTQNKSKKVDNE